ncbi:MAG: glycosyltransferase [Betaproteobacteria bacterium]|nr:glycosyltransferase [Betaproteobacteria bacterium]
MERFLGDLVAAQQARGDSVMVLVHDGGGRLEGGDPAWLRRCPVWLQLVFTPLSPTFGLWLRRAIREHDPEVLHLHVPNVSAFWALLLPSAWRLPWVVHWHSDVESSRFKVSLRLLYPFYRVLETALLDRAACIVSTSREYLEASGPLAPWREKCHVVALGMDPDRLPDVDAREGESLWPGAGLRVLAVGRLTYYKGFETLVAAAAAAGATLVIAGEGEERPVLERALAEAGDPANIRLAGAVDDTTLARLMASCDVFALPSRERTEAFGIVLMEAMRYAKPLLASRLAGSGMLAVAKEGVNALLAPPEDVPAWRAAIERLAADPSLRERLGRAGEARYRDEYHIASIAQGVDAIYRHANAVVSGDTRDDPVAPGRLLVVIPALNEAEDIGDVIDQVHGLGLADVLVVDDGSTDGTPDVARAHGATVMRAPLWQGAWGAIQTGLRYAVRRGYAGVVTLDADGQHEPAYVPGLLAAAGRADVVIAACPSRGSVMRHIAWSYFRILTGFRLEDLTRASGSANARACRLLAGPEATLLDYQDVGVLLLLSHARMRIVEIPVAMNARRHGASRVFSSWFTVGRYMAETTLLCLARGGFTRPGRRRPHAPADPAPNP